MTRTPLRFDGPSLLTGLPVGPDHGRLVAEYNVFRPVYAFRHDAKVVYFARSPVRVWHVDGETILRRNVVESSRQGLSLECRPGPPAACARGNILVDGNTIGGAVEDGGGARTSVNESAGVVLFTGLRARVRLDGTVFDLLPAAMEVFSDGVPGTPSRTTRNDRAITRKGTASVLRHARATTDPDLSYAKTARTALERAG